MTFSLANSILEKFLKNKKIKILKNKNLGKRLDYSGFYG
jgi:hypothetical protein